MIPVRMYQDERQLAWGKHVFHLDTSLQDSYLKHNICIYNISADTFAKITASLAQ